MLARPVRGVRWDQEAEDGYPKNKRKRRPIYKSEFHEMISMMKFGNVYFINGTAYAGKSTMVKALAEKYDGIACEENYQDALLDGLDAREFPSLTYTRDLANWSDFVRRTPAEYSAWIDGCIKECTILELRILDEVSKKRQESICRYQYPSRNIVGNLRQRPCFDYAGRP